MLDLGEGSVVPDEFLNIETRSSLWYRNLVAGAVAGAVSRTCTAPFDRLKIVMQVNLLIFHTVPLLNLTKRVS